jgi:hypothetical protein
VRIPDAEVYVGAGLGIGVVVGAEARGCVTASPMALAPLMCPKDWLTNGSVVVPRIWL